MSTLDIQTPCWKKVLGDPPKQNIDQTPETLDALGSAAKATVISMVSLQSDMDVSENSGFSPENHPIKK